MTSILRTMTFVGLAGVLTSCASMEIPNFDFIKFPEFKQDAENIGDFPKVEDAPLAPINVRSDKQWDAAAEKIIAERDGLVTPSGEAAKTTAEIERGMEKLRAEVDAYKTDDPK